MFEFIKKFHQDERGVAPTWLLPAAISGLGAFGSWVTGRRGRKAPAYSPFTSPETQALRAQALRASQGVLDPATAAMFTEARTEGAKGIRDLSGYLPSGGVARQIGKMYGDIGRQEALLTSQRQREAFGQLAGLEQMAAGEQRAAYESRLQQYMMEAGRRQQLQALFGQMGGAGLQQLMLQGSPWYKAMAAQLTDG